MVLKWNRIFAAGLLAFLSASGIMADEFEFGGVSFDFQKISDSRFKNKPKSTGENLVANSDFSKDNAESWTSGLGVHLEDSALAAKLRGQIKDLIVCKMAELPEGGKAAYIKKSLDLEGICAENTANVSAYWRQVVKMPDSSGGRYSVNFRYKGTVFGKFYTSCYMILVFRDAAGKQLSKSVKTENGRIVRCPNPKQDWEEFSADFEVSPDTASVELVLRLDGTGEVYFTDVHMQKSIKQDMPLSTCLAPMAFLDNTFCLSQNDPAIMTFAWRRNLPQDKLELKAPEFFVELPESVQLKDVREGLKLISSAAEIVGGKPYRIHKIGLGAVSKLSEDYMANPVQSILLFTDAAPGTELADAFYWISEGGRQLTKKESFHLKVLPSIRLSAKPDIFMNGFYIGRIYMNFPGTEGKELLGRFTGGTGAAWIVGKPDPEMTEIYRRNGIKIITPELYWVANGYRVGMGKDKPEYAKFKSLAKTKNVNIDNATCPVAVYTESGYFRESVMPYLETSLKGFDGLWANWEPYMFVGMGCFCDNCRDEFIKYSKLPAEEIKKAWPQEMAIGKKYYDMCTKFRSYQHSLMVKVIDKAVNSVTTGKAGFVPGVAFVSMTDSRNGRKICTEFDPLDYGASLKYIDPWGPYPCWPSLKPYSYSKGFNLSTFVAARKVREFTEKNFSNPKERPKLHALPHGIQAMFNVTQPEAITMDIISFFLNRYAASSTYAFPNGYDNRFWAAQAEASRLIAEYEKYVFTGAGFDGFSSEPATPYPAPEKRGQTRFFPEMPPVDMLQTAGFKMNGKYLAAVGNFWEKGDVFFKLSVKGLEKNAAYMLSQPDKKRYFAGEKADFITGAELENGILLHAGALRWAFFVVEPFENNKAYGVKMPPSAVLKAMKEHLPEIAKEAELENKKDAAEDFENRQSELKPLSSGKLSCTPLISPEGEQQLRFKSGENELLVGLNGMLVKSWKIGKDEVVSVDPDGKFGLGFPAFWQPSATIVVPYQVKRFEATASGIVIVAERNMTAKDSPALDYLTVRQKIEVDSACSSVKFETELLNGTSDETGPRDMTVGFRYHNMPLCIGDGGTVVMRENDRDVVFKRKLERMLFATPRDSGTAASMKKLFSVTSPEIKITAPEAVFISKDNKLSLTMRLAPADLFAGFACWDTPSLKSPSFEPFFSPVTIKSQESVKYTMTFEVK